MSLSKAQLAAVRSAESDPDCLRRLFVDLLDKAQWKEILEVRKSTLLNRRYKGRQAQNWRLVDGVCWAQDVKVQRVEPKRSKRLVEFNKEALKTILFQDGKGWWQDPFLFHLTRLQLGIALPNQLPTGWVSAERDFEAVITKLQEHSAEAAAYYDPPSNSRAGLKPTERSKWAEELIIACNNLIEHLNRSAGVLKAYSHIIREAEMVGYSRAFLEITRDPKKEELNTKAAAFIRKENPLTPLVKDHLKAYHQKHQRYPTLRELRDLIGCQTLSGKGRLKRIEINKKRYKDSQFVDTFKRQMKMLKHSR
jgi:hypothetical protein